MIFKVKATKDFQGKATKDFQGKATKDFVKANKDFQEKTKDFQAKRLPKIFKGNLYIPSSSIHECIIRKVYPICDTLGAMS
ncbi:hypothetical protein CEXT_526861 [Caerostris extrusa]|uniref:Uncharacterized protein n=1 Tax=Caerostris extrusa TaxID=172846 RepID=A0AAV4TYV5_CAEEX|nr:hypothetical protein CEXT_526861 [Caerostris extrusa]